MLAAEIIETITRRGGRIWLDEEKVRARLPEALRSLVSVIQSHKPELMDELARRPAIPAGVRLIQWAPKAAPIQVSECSIVTDTDKFIQVTLRQLDARLRGGTWHAGNWTLSNIIDRLAQCGCIVTLDDPRKGLQ